LIHGIASKRQIQIILHDLIHFDIRNASIGKDNFNKRNASATFIASRQAAAAFPPAQV
jgi:hypothetical protein